MRRMQITPIRPLPLSNQTVLQYGVQKGEIPMIRGLINGTLIQVAAFLVVYMIWEGIQHYA